MMPHWTLSVLVCVSRVSDSDLDAVTLRARDSQTDVTIHDVVVISHCSRLFDDIG